MAAVAERVKAPVRAARATPDEVERIREETQAWFRDVLSRFSIALVVLVLLLVIALIGNFVLFFSSTAVRYFAVTPDYRVVELRSLEEPALSAAGLKDWTRDTVVRALTLDFANYRQQLGDVEPRFTTPAFASFKAALAAAGILDLITRSRLVTSVTTEGAPVIVSEQRFNGALHWQLEFPVAVSYESSKGVEHTQHLLAKVLVGRVPPTQSAEGVRIAQIVLGPR